MNPRESLQDPVIAMRGILRCPITRAPLVWDGNGFVTPGSGHRYPLVDGILDLAPADERDADLGDHGHYDRCPFDCLDVDDSESLRSAIEPELQAFVGATPPEGLIADIGCGPGRVSIWLGRLGRRVLSLDYSWKSLRLLRPHVTHPLLHGNNLYLPLGDAVLDAVVSTGVVHHTPDPLLALRENCRVLRPGGRLYLHAYRAGSYYDVLYRSVGGGLRRLRRLGAPGRWLVDAAFFTAYRTASRVLKPRRSRQLRHQRNLYENYFLKDLVHPLRRSEIELVFAEMGMEIEMYSPSRQMHRYVARKRGLS